MDVMRYEPWSWLGLRDVLDQHFNKKEDESLVSTSNWMPAVDIKNESNRYLIHVDVPGVDPNQIEVTMEHNILTIKGERKTEAKESREGYSRIERISGSFYRRFSLPDDVDGEKIQAHSKQGVLVIEIPKTKQKISKKIEVKDKN